MKVVIVGARKRSEREDEPIVNKLMDDLLNRYPSLTIVATSCDRGVGKILKNRCLPLGTKNPKAQFKFVEITIRVYSAEELTKAELAETFSARNAMLQEIGEEFHVFVEEEPRGNMLDLIERVNRAGGPIAVYKKGEMEIKRPAIGG